MAARSSTRETTAETVSSTSHTARHIRCYPIGFLPAVVASQDVVWIGGRAEFSTPACVTPAGWCDGRRTTVAKHLRRIVDIEIASGSRERAEIQEAGSAKQQLDERLTGWCTGYPRIAGLSSAPVPRRIRVACRLAGVFTQQSLVLCFLPRLPQRRHLDVINGDPATTARPSQK